MKRTNALRLVDADYSTVVDVEKSVKHSNELIKLFNYYLDISKREIKNVLSQIAIATGENESNVDLFLKKKYPKDVFEFEQKFRDVLERMISLVDLNNDRLIFSDSTVNSKTIIEVLRATERKKIITSVLGNPGYSKTFTSKYFAKKFNALYLGLNRTDVSMNAVLTELEKHTHGSSYTKVSVIRLNNMVRWFRNENTTFYDDEDNKKKSNLIIVDQSDYLSPDAIDILRTISEEANIGLCFLGLPGFRKKLNMKRAEVKQLKDRISIMIELEPPTYEDLSNVLDLNWPGLTDELKREFSKYSRKTFRLLSHLINHVREDIYSEDNLGTELTVDHIRAAAGYLPKAINDEE